MSRNRDVFQVLVPTGNQAIAAEGTALSALLPGQIGIFSYNDNLALDGTDIPSASNFYLAVGQGTGGTLVDIFKSAGESIQRKNIVGYAARCYTPERPKIIELTDIKVKCNTEYGVKFEFRNQQAYRLNAYNAVTKAFIVKSDCCENCEDDSCFNGNALTLAQRLAAEVNADDEKLIIAQVITTSGTLTATAAATTSANATLTLGGGTPITVALVSGDSTTVVATKTTAAINAVANGAYKASSTGAVVTIYGPAGTVVWSAGTTGATATTTPVAKNVITDANIAILDGLATPASAGIRFTVAASTLSQLTGNINLNYFNPRGTDIIASLVIGFDCSGVLTTTQEMVYEEGLGYDIMQLEYEAGGWNGRPGPYRVSTLMGTERSGFFYQASANTKYLTIDLNYNNQSIGGWQHYTNHGATIVAIPTTDGTTINQLTAALDLLTAGNLKGVNAYAVGCPAVTVPNLSTASGNNFQDAAPGTY